MNRSATKPKPERVDPSGVSRSGETPPKSVSSLDKLMFSPPSFQWIRKLNYKFLPIENWLLNDIWKSGSTSPIWVGVPLTLPTNWVTGWPSWM